MDGRGFQSLTRGDESDLLRGGTKLFGELGFGSSEVLRRRRLRRTVATSSCRRDSLMTSIPKLSLARLRRTVRGSGGARLELNLLLRSPCSSLKWGFKLAGLGLIYCVLSAGAFGVNVDGPANMLLTIAVPKFACLLSWGRPESMVLPKLAAVALLSWLSMPSSLTGDLDRDSCGRGVDELGNWAKSESLSSDF